ncbi:MAG: DUF2185 domain-containing protein [Chitinophagaceae bacterium]|uniref:DUF2185 domain-containing protein n=1 Tax=unclassified Paraflavitalea TaxID=2798305 RepID=UPI003D325923|nr:DUF2185 domain-containing protein [Chitinophagaceae bacterium]
MQIKKFKLSEKQLEQLVDKVGSCIATDKITVEGLLVGYMYRTEPEFDSDSGWRFFSGTESQEYVDNPNNSMIYSVNTIANYDKAIIPFLEFDIGTELERTIDNIFITVVHDK